MSNNCCSLNQCQLFTCFSMFDIIRSLSSRSWREYAASWAAHRAADTFRGTEPDTART